MKDELKIVLRPKTYSYLRDDGHVYKKVECTKKCVIKREIKFEDYKTCLQNRTLGQC